MAPTSDQVRSADARIAPRTSIYLAAALYCDGASAPVKIRNMSTAGALVEGAVLPDLGSLVQLVRGGLIVHGLVSWSSDGRCGLKFSGLVDVQRWQAVPSNNEQQRVDEIVRLVKAGAVPLAVPPLAKTDDRGETPDADISGDLRRAAQLLDCLCNVLASDPDIIERQGSALQNLDIAIQMIGAVEAVIAGGPNLDSDGARLGALRISADQALLGHG
ncbi:MAG TPA: hypothetical protein VGQ34_09865 [Sphingomicrobium sp.]|jgi:hypothetical protein|nr:hypothetical protein [Sphingomicrobium sp.]